MGRTTLSGPLLVGTIKDGSAENLGTCILQQDTVFTIPANIANVTNPDGQTFSLYNTVNAVPFAAFGVAATSSTIILPANSQIDDIVIDVPTAIVGPTAANLTVGITAAGQDYVSTLNLLTGPVVRVRPTFTNAQLLAMMNITTNLTIYAQLTGTVANFTAGVVYVQIKYTNNG